MPHLAMRKRKQMFVVFDTGEDVHGVGRTDEGEVSGKTKTKFIIIIMRIIGFLWQWLWPERLKENRQNIVYVNYVPRHRRFHRRRRRQQQP